MSENVYFDIMTSQDPDRIYSVSEYLEFINTLLNPAQAFIQGEVVSVTERGYAVYFTLSDKEEKAVINCLVWKSKLRAMGVVLKEGEEIQVQAFPQIYKPTGRLSLQVQYIIPVGEGALKAAFERLKKELETMGYFAEGRKRQIPQYITKIGLITSDAANAKKDFLTHIDNFGYTIHFYDVRVEGVKAIPSVCKAIQYFNQHPNAVDVLVVTRGGGSLESLQAFNSLDIAQAIFSSKIPVIAAIGHENDITIADLVADIRASTPTHAGKIVGTDWVLAEERIIGIQSSIMSHLKTTAIHADSQLFHLEENIAYLFGKRLQEDRKNFKEKEKLYFKTAAKWLDDLACKVDEYNKLLEAFNPQNRLKQGYSIVTNKNGKVVKSTNAINISDPLTVRLFKGMVETTVEKIR